MSLSALQVEHAGELCCNVLSLLPLTKQEVNAFARVCLSVSKITQKRMRAWMKCCVSTDVGTWTN